MTEIYDIVMMVGDLVLILMFFWFIAEVGSLFLDEFSGASARIIQEFVSGHASMSNFAPAVFSAEEKFPAVNHMMKISENPPIVSVKVGSRGLLSAPTTGQNLPVLITFAQKAPLQYFLSDSIILLGDCLDNFCAFSGETQNKIKVKKDADSVAFLLNRESLATGSMYKLGKRIFYGECDSKIYSADYLFAGTSSIRVEVKEDDQIIKEGTSPTHEIMIGETKIINNLKITLYSLDTSTNIASITAECA